MHLREPAVDHRLKRILQVCSDVVGKPLSECRVVRIEGRVASVAKCNFARDALRFDRAKFHRDDVRDVSVAKDGVFDEFQRDSNRGKSARK